MRTLVEAVFRLAFRIFFRRIEIVGEERYPESGPTLLALNHPNGLMDPGVIQCFSPRPISFLAKSTLFHMPVIGPLARAVGAVPVFRRKDGVDTSQNRNAFDAARGLLQSGGVLALFPEGISHNEPNLQPLKTGAARIALGAASGGDLVTILPAGLFFTDKVTFRSDVLLVYGEPFTVEGVELDAALEPPRDVTREVTTRIETALEGVILQADEVAALTLVGRAERLYVGGASKTLYASFQLRRRFLAGYRMLEDSEPETLAALVSDVNQLERECTSLGLDPARLDPDDFRRSRVLVYAARAALGLGVLAPLAAVGFAVHIVPYQLVDRLARRFARDEHDVLSTGKLFGAMMFFPAMWLIVAACGGVAFGPWGFAALFGLGPVSGGAALVFREWFGDVWTATRSLFAFARRRGAYEDIRARQADIRSKINALESRLGESPV